jgi:diguanylate cyclase
MAEDDKSRDAKGKADEKDKDDISVLKSVLPLMSRHATGYNPISYTVWYEYAKGRPLELKRDVEAELQYRERLSAAQTYALYVKHLVEPAERAVLSARSGLLDLVADVKDSVQDADHKTSGYDAQLQRFAQDLAKAEAVVDPKLVPSMAHVKGNLALMLEETRRASEGFGRISGQLEKCRTAVAQLEDELRSAREAAQTDSLSGLLNRRGFDRELERLSLREDRPATLGLIMIDIDNFKTVNDTYGHPLGDAVIAAVGQAIRDCIGVSGVGARYGGEEFAVLLPEADQEQATKIAQAIRVRVEQGKIKRRKDDQAIGGITVSAGVAMRKGDEEPAALLERADAALYAAKHGGRNRVVVDA